MASAASTAWRAWSGSSSGAPQKAISASPMYLSSVPRWARTTSVRCENSRFIIAPSSAGGMRWATAVKPDTSANSTVSVALRLAMP